MPKKKTHKGAAKRCKITGSGKVVATRAGKRHLANGKPRKEKRNLRGTARLSRADEKNVKTFLAS